MQDVITGREARLIYGDGDFEVQRRGDYVVCAVTSRRIALGELRYWSVTRQEAYADASAAAEGYARAEADGKGF